MTKTVYKGYKYRIYPNKEQRDFIDRTFDACRYVYNKALELCIKTYEELGRMCSYADCCRMLTVWKQEEDTWLCEFENRALRCSIEKVMTAYRRFFKEGAGYPKFKSGFYKQSYTTDAIPPHGIGIDFKTNRIKLPKIAQPIKAVLHRQFTGDIVSVTVSRDSSGKYYASFRTLEQHTVLPKQKGKVGIDLGIKHLATLSNGDKIDNDKFFRKHERKLARIQRKLSRQQKGSKKYEKQRKKLARLHEKIRHKREYKHHELSSKIIKENMVICTEDLAVQNMMKNKHLSKSILDAGWYQFIWQLEYKSDWNGRLFQKVERTYPSSQLCSICGFKNEKVKNLSVRHWKCPNCGVEHDRDINAAINILYEGARLILDRPEIKERIQRRKLNTVTA